MKPKRNGFTRWILPKTNADLWRTIEINLNICVVVLTIPIAFFVVLFAVELLHSIVKH